MTQSRDDAELRGRAAALRWGVVLGAGLSMFVGAMTLDLCGMHGELSNWLALVGAGFVLLQGTAGALD